MTSAPDRFTLDKLLNRLVERVVRCLTRDGLLVADPEQSWLDFEADDDLDTLHAASIRYCVAVGSEAGRRALTLKNPSLEHHNATPKAFTSNRDDFP